MLENIQPTNDLDNGIMCFENFSNNYDYVQLIKLNFIKKEPNEI